MNDDKTLNALNTWIETMQTLNPQAVSDLYADDSQFWGTLAKDLSTEEASRLAYFNSFLDGKEGLSISLNDDTKIHSFSDTGLISGSYVFSFGDTSIPARYSFTFNNEGKILHHHSSLIPA